MAEPLKNRFGPQVPTRIAAMVTAAHPSFPTRAFVRDALAGYEPLDLMARARHIATALHAIEVEDTLVKIMKEAAAA